MTMIQLIACIGMIAGLFIVLHISLLFSSLSGVCSKMAAAQTDLKGFGMWYFAVLLIMAVYAVIWQQITA